MWWALSALLVTAAAFVAHAARKRARTHQRQVLRSNPFPPAWDAILRETLPVYPVLPDALREELHDLVQVFVGEKRFEPCGGLELTDEIRVTIAAQACLLILNRAIEAPYASLKSILVYPAAYRATGLRMSEGGGSVLESEQVRLGESWTGGAVVLTWDNVRRGASNFHDGHNVVLHEFAHQLDQEDGRGDGAPILQARSSYRSWARVLGHEYQTLRDRVAHHRATVLDEYGATDPAEFFAVATEVFFEKPRTLSRKHPELYAELSGFYGVDPLNWNEPPG